jgi:assimilatory nitrate reductase catalytic subunit
MSSAPPIAKTVRTTCPYCGVGCGVLATPQADGSVTIAGDPDHPANFGRLCSKGAALGETLSLDGRLLHPEVDRRRTSWDEALDLVASTFLKAIAEHGPDSVAFYGSGQLLTEDYYVANKLMKGFIGTANIDTNSRLCMASSVAGHRRAFGSDTVPGNYEDIELADLVVLIGTNLAWCHPVIYQRLAAAKAARPAMRVVVIDPRRTITSDIADLHLPIAADGDNALLVGLLEHIRAGSHVDQTFVAANTTGLAAALDIAHDWTIARVADATGLVRGDIATFYDWFGATEKVVTIFSQGVNQSASGTDKVNAIINCHLATGRIGRHSMGPFSITGQPNAMGGREVGGLANMLAAHMDFDDAAVDRVARFWGSSNVARKPGLKAVDMFRAVGEGRIKALWIMATNPVDSMPEADAVRAVLRACPFVVVSDMNADTDTVIEARVRLPAAGWGEKNGTVTNSERRISRQRPFLATPGEARPDWWIVSEVARRMEFGAAFSYASPAEVFAEHASLSAFENDGARDFDLSGLLGADYDALEPVQWPIRAAGTARMFEDGRFFTPDSKARFVPVAPPPPLRPAPGWLTLNTGRVRDHWHTMTRTGKSQRLSAHMAEPFAEIHPGDASRLGIQRATLVQIENQHGQMIARALISDRQRRGSIFVPMHWTDRVSANGRVDALVTGKTDPHSGQPALKMGEVLASPLRVAMYGFAISVQPPATAGLLYWADAPIAEGIRTELAWANSCDWKEEARRLFGLSADAPLAAAKDERTGRQSFAAFNGDRLVFALYVSPEPVLVSRQWAAGLLALSFDAKFRLQVLAGRPGADIADPGPIVCACFGVGRNAIMNAARKHNDLTVDAIGRRLRAGTNCGSCRPEIASLLESAAVEGD